MHSIKIEHKATHENYSDNLFSCFLQRKSLLMETLQLGSCQRVVETMTTIS
jgi:hypothetical protein